MRPGHPAWLLRCLQRRAGWGRVLRNPLRQGAENGGSRHQVWCGDLKEPLPDLEQPWPWNRRTTAGLVGFAGCCGLCGWRSFGEPAGSVGQGFAVAPDFVQRRLNLLGFDGRAWFQLLAGRVIGLIALYSSYNHISLGPASAQLEQALIKFSSGEVQALYDDEVLELLVGLR